MFVDAYIKQKVMYTGEHAWQILCTQFSGNIWRQNSSFLKLICTFYGLLLGNHSVRNFTSKTDPRIIIDSRHFYDINSMLNKTYIYNKTYKTYKEYKY